MFTLHTLHNMWIILVNCGEIVYIYIYIYIYTLLARLMGPTWGPPGSCRPQVGFMWAPWTLLSGYILSFSWYYSTKYVQDDGIIFHPLEMRHYAGLHARVGVNTQAQIYIYIQNVHIQKHHCDVIMGAVASRSPASRLFTKPLIQTQIKENIKAPCHWPLYRGPVNFPHKKPVTRKMFPVDDVIMKIHQFNVCRRTSPSCKQHHHRNVMASQITANSTVHSTACPG